MNNINIEARKLSIIEYLAELQDEGVIQQIENIIKPKLDFWDQLPINEKNIILKGIEDLNQNKKTEFNQFIAKYRKNSK